jgi:hypothetical protein
LIFLDRARALDVQSLRTWEITASRSGAQAELIVSIVLRSSNVRIVATAVLES